MITGNLDRGIAVAIESRLSLTTVRAGSALLAVDDRLLVVGDDAHAVSWIDLTTGDERLQVLDGSGGPMGKLDKPDFEAAAIAPDGTVWLFGSGSLPNRRHAIRLGGEPYDAEALFEVVETTLGGTPNLEGAVFVGDALRLFHRAVGDEPDVWFDVVDLDSPRVVDTQVLRLGSLEGVPLHLTDTALTPEGRLAFLASAEATDDPVVDGDVAGSVLGVIDGTVARWVPLTDQKAEGLVLDGDGGWFVTDIDDAGESADVVRFTAVLTGSFT